MNAEAQVENAVRSFDPRARLALVFALSSLGVFINDPWWLAGIFLLTLFTAWGFGGNWYVLKKTLPWVLSLLILFAFLQSLTRCGEPVFLALGRLTLLTGRGISEAVQFALRVLIIVVSASVLARETSRRIVQALVQMRIPYELAFMTSVGVRFLKVLRDEMGNSLVAMQLRGVELKKIPLVKRLPIYTYLLLPVLSGAIFKARQLSLSVELRGFKLHYQRSSYFRLSLMPHDWLVIIASFLAAVLVLAAYFSRNLWL